MLTGIPTDERLIRTEDGADSYVGETETYCKIGIECRGLNLPKVQAKAEQPIPRKFALKSSEAGFRPVILGSVYHYMVVPLNKIEQKIFPACRSIRIPMTSNLLWATTPKTLTVQKPKIVTPGLAGASAPGTTRTLEKPVPTKMPETFIPREMEIKTPNPSTFSAWGKLHGLKSETVTTLLQDKMGNKIPLAKREIGLVAVGLINTRLPNGEKGISMLISIGVFFNPGFQLSFGFTLNAVGGLIGIHRTIKVDILRERIQNGAVNSIMFAENVIQNSSKIISDLRAVFPPQKNHYVVAPFFRIGYSTPAVSK